MYEQEIAVYDRATGRVREGRNARVQGHSPANIWATLGPAEPIEYAIGGDGLVSRIAEQIYMGIENYSRDSEKLTDKQGRILRDAISVLGLR